jgi:hypothetical protein
MADFYRINGNAGVVGDGKGFISTAIGASFIGKFPVAIAGYIANSSGTAQDLRSESGVNNAIPAILTSISSNVTVLAYQIEATTGGNISLLLEGAAGLASTDAGIATVIQNTVRSLTAAGNNAVDCSGSLFVNKGFKLSYT